MTLLRVGKVYNETLNSQLKVTDQKQVHTLPTHSLCIITLRIPVPTSPSLVITNSLVKQIPLSRIDTHIFIYSVKF